MSFNLHADCTNADHEGPPQPRCERCGWLYSDYEDSLAKLCPDCYDLELREYGEEAEADEQTKP